MDSPEKATAPNPPCDDPLQYCRLCFSQFEVTPILSSIAAQIGSLLQIKLDDKQAFGAICAMCRHQLTEFQLFRNRSQHHQPGNLTVSATEDDLWFSVEPGGESDEEFAPLNKSDKHKNVTASMQDDQLNRTFWRALSRDIGAIPEHIQHSLELTGFGRNASLGMISPMTIKQIEQDMRDSIEIVTSRGAARGADPVEILRKFYGPVYCSNPNKFKFLAGEVQTILSITAAIQDNGIHQYLKVKASTTQSRKPPLIEEKPWDAERFAESLVQKIKDYYAARAVDSEEFRTFFANLPEVTDCDVRQSQEGIVYAILCCPFCHRNQRITYENCWWRVFNYVRHCQKHYQALPAKRKRVEEDDAEASEEEAE